MPALNKRQVAFALAGLILLSLGLLQVRKTVQLSPERVSVLEATTEAQKTQTDIVVEISGQVEKPGVYKLQNGSRVEDLIVAAGGISAEADRVWLDKTLNRAAKLLDGQKLFIPPKNSGDIKVYQPSNAVQGSGLININTAGLSDLDTLPGIGPVYGQNIIEHRPYSNIEELVSKGALKEFVFEKIKDKITAY
ncbi:helix-hairpin-helix domain-containing protein [Patescibacteria group bacterium]|nr:helix-hairpin-helix domain-containing protein [Patescibacteria group bacterium]